MKNKNKQIRNAVMILLAMAVLLLAGCATTVSFSSLVPAEVNMTGYKTVAFASTEPYRGSWGTHYIDYKGGSLPWGLLSDYELSDRDLYTDTAKYVTKALEKSLDKGVYTITHSTETDQIIMGAKALGYTVRQALMERGIDVLITTNIADQQYYQWVTCETEKGKDGTVYYNYFLNTEARIAIDYVVQDVENAIVIDRGTLKKEYSEFSPEFIGSMKSKSGQADSWSDGSYWSEPVLSIFTGMVDSLSSNFYKRLTPYQKTTNLALKEAKSDAMKAAIKSAEDGQYTVALEQFLNEWNTKGDINAAYNATVMYAATEGFEKAITFADEVYNKTYDPDIQKLSVKIQEILGLDLRARQQITGEKSTITKETELIGF